MGSFNVTNSIELPPLRVRVVIDGQTRSDVYCSSVALGSGTAGSTASFTAPALTWDGGKSQFRGAFVQVFVRYEGGNETQVFNGYITTATGGVSNNFIDLSARSLISLSDNVYLGQDDAVDNGLSIDYPREVVRSGVPTSTGWNVRTVLRDLFSGNGATWRGGGGSIPSAWRSRLKLGSLSALTSSYNDITLGDIAFHQATLKDALDQVVGLIGTVSFKERFQGVATYLDFYELADPTAPVRTVRVARSGEGIAGTNVLSIDHEEGSDDVKTRIIALGDRRKHVVSITNTHSTAPLVEDWNLALETAVLANPEGTKRGSDAGNAGDETRTEFSPAKAKVFRNYKLPECVRRLVVEKDNAVDLSDGSRLGIQVWKIPRTLIYNDGTGAWGSSIAATPVILEGTQFDLEQGTFVLKSPAINLVSTAIDSAGNPSDVWEQATVGITITVGAERLSRDTGVRANGLSFDGIRGDGLVESFVNESFGYRQITNIGSPFKDANGGTHTFGDTWLYIDGTGWEYHPTATILQDDENALREFVDIALREKNRVKATYSITTPFWTPAYALGERINVVGQGDFEYGTHQVLSVSYELGNDHSTTFSTDNAVPLIASQVLGEGG